MRDGADDGDDDRTVMNHSIDEDATIIGDPDNDTTYIASLKGKQEPKGNTEAGRLLKNRFVLEERIGSGGMGDVYKALDLRQQEAQEKDPYIAIKLLNDSFARHKDAFISLQRETSRMRGIPHPNIMAVYDFDKEGDTVFMSMELLDGKPLDDYLKEHPEGVSQDDAWNIIEGICHGLIRAHDAGIVHSDFKPGNIFYTREKIAKVFDFGIARAVSNPDEIEAEGEKTVFDAGSLGALTPTYASYEMLKGMNPSKSDDVYAVALVAYELFMGKHPYDRVPADKVLERGLVPKRVPFLKHRHWKALEKALQLRGEDRTQTVDEFFENIFSEDPPYLRYASIAAIVLASAGAVTYSMMNEKVKPKELVAFESGMQAAQTTIKDRLATPNLASEDWHDQVHLALIRWKNQNIQIQENEEWAEWEIVDQSIDDPRDANDIPSKEDQILEVYLKAIKDNVEAAGKLEPEGADLADRNVEQELETTQQALAILETADSYMDIVKQRYAHIDPARVSEVAFPLGISLESKRYREQDLLDKQRIAAKERADEEERRRLATEEEQRKAARNSAYVALTDDLKEILRCRGDIPDSELKRSGDILRQMQTLYPDQYEVDTPGMVTAFAGCIKRRIGFVDPVRARAVKQVAAGYFPDQDAITGMVIEDKDPCQARGLEGQGFRSRSFCVDPLSEGGIGPQLVVIPPSQKASDGLPAKYAISRTEIKVGDYNQYCEKTGCAPLPGVSSIPATGITVEQARAYANWLSAQSGKDYRLPTLAEWAHAATTSDPANSVDDNVNCTVDSRGVRLGDKLLSSLSGRPNPWGLFNHVGNAREWAVLADGGLLAMGGAHTDPKADCTLDKSVTHSGAGDPVTGFRLVREIPIKNLNQPSMASQS